VRGGAYTYITEVGYLRVCSRLAYPEAACGRLSASDWSRRSSRTHGVQTRAVSRLRSGLLAVLLLTVPLSCGDSSGSGQGNVLPTPSPPVAVQIGTLGYNPAKTVGTFAALVGHLNQTLAPEHVTVEAVCAISVANAIDMLRRGEIDVLIDQPGDRLLHRP